MKRCHWVNLWDALDDACPLTVFVDAVDTGRSPSAVHGRNAESRRRFEWNMDLTKGLLTSSARVASEYGLGELGRSASDEADSPSVVSCRI